MRAIQDHTIQHHLITPYTAVKRAKRKADKEAWHQAHPYVRGVLIHSGSTYRLHPRDPRPRAMRRASQRKNEKAARSAQK